VIGAVVLPWVAVVIANGGADVVHQETVELLDEAPRYAIDGAPDGTGENGAGDILTGELVPDDDSAFGGYSAGEDSASEDETSQNETRRTHAGDERTQEDGRREHL
jgi:hypothetical protein